MNIKLLLNEPESEYLDFKREYYDNTLDFVHDLLCLSNSLCDKDRYIIFGVDNTGNILGIENDTKRKNLEKIIDTIKSSNINKIPVLELETLNINNHEIDILIIKNSKFKPFFLIKDKTEKGKAKIIRAKIIRAGVIYTRSGPTNTPINSTASEYEIAEMWKERFGLNLSILERLNTYIDDFENWNYFTDEINGLQLYYKYFPEFTITSKSKGRENYSFANHLPKKDVFLDELSFKYHSTTLTTCQFVSVDGARYYFPFPDSSVYYVKDILSDDIYIDYSKLNEIRFFLEDSFHYKVYKIFTNLKLSGYDLNYFNKHALNEYEKIFIFNDKNELIDFIKQDKTLYSDTSKPKSPYAS
ncbi:MAG TPA: ATP-binding protein [Candidatus Gastranaerophilales bacterium]|nr:ATP-binding protein [Candidatus Gastranaerophilales bacterium]